MTDLPFLIAKIDTGDTAWMLMATALVIFMTIGLGLFYAGLVRAKNSLNTFMMCIAAFAVVTISWALVGYSLAFGEGSGFIGNFDYAFLKDVGFEPYAEGQTIPHLVFFAFQGSFCIITAALVSGAVVERMRFSTYLIFIALWSIFVYPVLAHWVFGGGFLFDGGTLDFAGGISVEMALRVLRTGRGARGRRAQGLRPPGAAAPQRRPRAARRRDPLVRLVRLQRR